MSELLERTGFHKPNVGPVQKPKKIQDPDAREDAVVELSHQPLLGLCVFLPLSGELLSLKDIGICTFRVVDGRHMFKLLVVPAGLFYRVSHNLVWEIERPKILGELRFWGSIHTLTYMYVFIFTNLENHSQQSQSPAVLG